jgi:hypothetical protein
VRPGQRLRIRVRDGVFETIVAAPGAPRPASI